jgi:hypothetical protein
MLCLGHGVFKQECVFQELSVGLRSVFRLVGLKGLFQSDSVREKLCIGAG